MVNMLLPLSPKQNEPLHSCGLCFMHRYVDFLVGFQFPVPQELLSKSTPFSISVNCRNHDNDVYVCAVLTSG